MRTLLLGAIALLCSSSIARAALNLDALPAANTPVLLSPSELAQPQSALKVALPGETLTFATQVAHPQAGMIGVRGTTSDAENRLEVFVWNGRILSADVYAADGRYQAVANMGALHWVRDADIPRTISQIHDNSLDAPRSLAPLATVGAKAQTEPTGANGNYRIDVQALYTPEYQQRIAGTTSSIQAEVQRLIFLANTYFANSEIPVEYRLVGSALYAGVSELGDCNANIRSMQTDGAVKALRDSAGADVVVLLRTSDHEGTGGIGMPFNGADQSDPPININSERDGFACVDAAPSSDGSDARLLDVEHLFAHELGHVLSGGHQYAGPKKTGAPPFNISGNYWRPYGHAWHCGVASLGSVTPPLYPPSPYYTIMNSNIESNGGNLIFDSSAGPQPLPNVGYGPFAPKGDFFSNPRQKLTGTACGIYVVQPPLGEALQADNARSITEAAPYVAAYRPTAVP